MTVTIWHNPRCSKSRQTLELLREKDVEPSIRLYLEDVPSEQELRDTLALLGVKPHDLLRRKESSYKDAGLSVESSEAEVIEAMIKFPKLIERPVVFANGQARIGRPPEAVLDIL